LLSSRTDVSETLAPLDLDAYALDAALRKALKLSERWLAMPPVELKSLVQEIVDRITVAADQIEIQLSRAKIAAALQVGERGQRPDLDPVVLVHDMRIYTAVEVLFGMHYAEAVTVDDQRRPVADLTRLSLVEPDPSAHPD
jgi:hypothetical protein